jgi:hypothetical protein
MSNTTSVASTTATTYATELAETSKLKRSLYSIGSAIESGNLAAAGSKLTVLMKSYPQYAASTNAATDTASSSVNDDFKAISQAIKNNNVEAAKTAWAQLKTDLSNAGVKNLNNGSADTAKLLADNQASINKSILSAFFGSSDSSVSTLLGSTTASGGSDSVSSVLSNWATYQATGSSGATSDSNSGKVLNTTA